MPADVASRVGYPRGDPDPLGDPVPLGQFAQLRIAGPGGDVRAVSVGEDPVDRGGSGPPLRLDRRRNQVPAGGTECRRVPVTEYRPVSVEQHVADVRIAVYQ